MSRISAFYLRSLVNAVKHRGIRFDTIFMVGGIVISVAVLMAAFSLFSGYENALKQAILGANSHLYVFRTGNGDLDSTAVAEVGAVLRSEPEVECWAPAVTGQAVAVNGSVYRGIVLRGVDSAAKEQPTRYQEFVRSGSADIRNDDDAVLGSRLAAELSVGVGDTVKLSSPLGARFTPFGFVTRERKFRVVGLYRSGMFEYDSHYFFVNPSVASEFTTHPGQATLIEVRLKHPENAWVTAYNIEARLENPESDAEYQVSTWIDQYGNLFSLITVEKWMLFFILSLLVLIAAFNTVSGVTTMILERRRQIGILRAIGMTNRMLRSMFFLRVLGLATIATLCGEVLGVLLGKLIQWQTIYRIKGDVYFLDQLYSRTPVTTWVIVFVTALMIVAVACAFPLRRISRLQVTEILRGNE
jgi:lipoprotein-releasing system permease protein